jgi:hypothetical protein
MVWISHARRKTKGPLVPPLNPYRKHANPDCRIGCAVLEGARLDCPIDANGRTKLITDFGNLRVRLAAPPTAATPNQCCHAASGSRGPHRITSTPISRTHKPKLPAPPLGTGYGQDRPLMRSFLAAHDPSEKYRLCPAHCPAAIKKKPCAALLPFPAPRDSSVGCRRVVASAKNEGSGGPLGKQRFSRLPVREDHHDK